MNNTLRRISLTVQRCVVPVLLSGFCLVLAVFGSFPFLFPQTIAANQDNEIVNEKPSVSLNRLLESVDQARGPTDNWSPIERRALAEAQSRASIDCRHYNFGSTDPSSLLAIARLCAFGNRWPEALNAASSYVAHAPEHSLDGLVLIQRSQIRMGRVEEAVATARRIASLSSFDTQSNAALDEIIDALQYSYPIQALQIARLRQPLLLARIQESLDSNAEASISDVHSLFTSALLLPVLLRFEGADSEADEEHSQLSTLKDRYASKETGVADYLLDAYPFYSLLGSPLQPTMRTIAKAPQPRQLSVLRIFLIQPPDCLGCGELSAQFIRFANRNRPRGFTFGVGIVSSANLKGLSNSQRFRLNGKTLNEAEKRQLAALGCLEHPAILFINRHNQIVRVYYPTATFLRPNAAFDELLSRF
jgi:hypothetical protein